MSVLFLVKTNDPFCEIAKGFINHHFSDSTIITCSRNEPLPENINWDGDYIISYLFPWVVPYSLLKRSKKANINFHPGPPEYPGIGCTNFALYNNEKIYGVTCHHMEAKVDTGPIIAVKRFPVLLHDSILSLTKRAYTYLLTLFFEVMIKIANNEPLLNSDETWTRKPYKRVDLDALCEIKANMTNQEIHRRIRATYFPGMPGPFINLGGAKFILDAECYNHKS